MATQVRFYGIRYYASGSTSNPETWFPGSGGIDVTFYDTNCNKINATGSGSRWTFTVPSLPYTIFIKKGGSTSSIYPEAGKESRIYIYTISATEYDDVTPYIYEDTDREKGSIWQGYREVLEVYQGETCVYKVKKPKKTNHVFYVGFSTGSGTPTVSVNGSTYSSYHGQTIIDSKPYYLYYYPGRSYDDPSTVYVGQEVVWTAAATNYKTEGGTIYASSSDPSTTVQLQQGENVRLLDIVPTPAASTVYFNNSYSFNKRYMATYGEVVNWRVENYGYDTSSGQITMTQDTSLYVNLTNSVRRFIFDVTPTGATIEVSETGPSNYVPISGTVYETTSTTYLYYRISLNGYDTITDYAWWNGGDTYIYETLSPHVNTYNVTFNITPSSGNTIYINNSETPLSGNTYTASENEVVSYRIVNDDPRYAESSGQTSPITQNTAISITLSIKQVTFTVIPEPSDATVTFTVGGTTYVQNSITMAAGTEFSYVVSKTGYTPVSSGTISIYNSDSTTVTLGVQRITHEFRITPKNSSTENYVFTINNVSVPIEYPSDVNYARVTYTGNFEDELNWQITADHYYSQNGTYVLVDSDDESYEAYTAISLTTKMYAIYAYVEDDNTQNLVQDATVKIKFSSSGSWQTFTRSTWNTDLVTSAAYGVTVYYEVTATGWDGYTGCSGNFVSGQNNSPYYIHAYMVKAQCTVTISPTPNDATVTINGVTRKTITVNQGSTISYTVSKTGYTTESNDNYIVPYQSTVTIPVTLAVASSNYTLTVNRADPSSGMVVQYAIVDSAGRDPGTLTILSGNTIDVSANKYVYLLGSDNNVRYADKVTYVYMNSNKTENVDLDRKPRLTFASITPSDATVYVYNPYGSVVSKSNDGYYYFNGSEIGNQFTYTVSKYGYQQVSGSGIIGDWESTTTIPAIELYEESCTVTIITDPWNCQLTVKDYDTSETLTPDQLNSSTWEVAITKGHRLQYQVSRTQWNTSAPNPNSYTITSDRTIYVNLTCPTTTPLSFECRTQGQITPVQVGSVGTRQLQYRTINPAGTISDWQTNTTGFYPTGSAAPITVYPGYTYQFKAKTTVDSYSDPYGTPDSNYCYFKLTNQQGALSGDFRVFGNIKSLLDPTQSNYQSTTAKTTESWYTYNRMFYGQTALKSARQLILRSTDPQLGAYREMFRGCTNLEAACTSQTSFPTLDSGNSKLYESMFYGCSSLTKAPTLRNITTGLGTDMYKQMFYNCTSLNQVTWLLTANAPNASYCSNWLYGVSSTGQFIKSSSATWSTPSRSASTIPANWTITTQ